MATKKLSDCKPIKGTAPKFTAKQAKALAKTFNGPYAGSSKRGKK